VECPTVANTFVRTSTAAPSNTDTPDHPGSVGSNATNRATNTGH
jgi:hypothetical protein